MDSEILRHIPMSIQIWQKIEMEAERRAEERYQKILNRNNEKKDSSTDQAERRC